MAVSDSDDDTGRGGLESGGNSKRIDDFAEDYFRCTAARDIFHLRVAGDLLAVSRLFFGN